MTGRRLALGAIVFLAIGFAVVVRSEPEWPDTDVSRRVQAWFAQLSGTDTEAQEFFQTNFSEESLADASMETRLDRRRILLRRTGGLTPLEVTEATPTSMKVLTRAGNGEEPLLVVEAEESAPYLLKSVRVALEGSSPGDPPKSSGPPLSDNETVRQIRALLDAGADSGRFSGAVILARRGQPLLRDAWGVADRATGTPITVETRFNLGSLGKIPTRLAIAQLAQQAKLSIDDKLSRFLPDFPHADEMTVHMLAKHRSGVGDIFNEKYRAMDHTKLLHNRDFLPLIRDQALLFEPGTKQRYSNGGFVLLGEVIAKTTEMDYYDYLAKYIYLPAGMKATAALVEGDGTPNVARGYTKGGVVNGVERDNLETRPWRGSAAGGSYSTVDDFLRFDQALVKGRLCDPDWASWVWGGPRPAAPKPSFALGGGAPGICTEWTHEGDLTLIVFSNRDPETTQPVLDTVRGLFKRLEP